METNEEVLEPEGKFKRISIDWGRQGGIILGYVIIVLGYYGLIANTMMYDDLGNWISFVDMDKTILIWTYTTYISANLDVEIFIVIFVVLTVLIIFFSLVEKYSVIALSILIPVFLIFILDVYWNLFDIMTLIRTGNYYLAVPGLAIVLLFMVCFTLTYKEEIPQYGIKASLWMVPVLVVLGFFFYTIMFRFSLDPLILQFGRGEGYINLLLLYLTVLSGSFSGMKIKKRVAKRKELSELRT
jgi:hypothetical protein